MAMMSIYIDESYSHPPKPEVYTIAGYVSEDWRWKRFEREWSKTLASEGLEYFHMVEFAHKKGVYADWPESKRRKFLRTLHYIIHSNTIIDFSVNVVVAAYNEMITPGIRLGFGEPHVFAVIGCMKEMGRWAKATNLRGRIQYVFEQGTVHDKLLRKIFETADTDQDDYYRLGGCSFSSKTEMLPLQAADTLAYENMLEMRRRVDPGNTRPMRVSARNLERPQSLWTYYDKDQLSQVLENAERAGLILKAETKD